MVHVGTAGTQGPCIYLIDSPDHPSVLDEMAPLRCSLARVPVTNWGDALTPWPAPALYRGETDYAGRADETLRWLREKAIPQAERDAGLAPSSRAIAGYSLAGLFSLYAFLADDFFAAVGCLSGSLWYDGWLEHLEQCVTPVAGRYAYFSLGSKEKRGAPPRIKAVQQRTETCVALLRNRGARCDYVLNPGGHLTHVDERIAAGILALDQALCS